MEVWPQFHIAGDFIVKAGSTLGPRVIGDYEIAYFPHPSSGFYTVEGTTFSLEHPCFTLTGPGETHHYRFHENRPTRHQFIHFELGAMLRDSIARKPFGGCIPQQGLPQVTGHLNEIMKISYDKGTLWRERCSALLLLILCSLLQQETSGRSAVSEPIVITHAKRYIAERLDQALTVKEIAHAVGWSHEHLTRSFQQYVGLSPQLYIMQQRVEFSCKRLIGSTESIKQIAFHSGFADEHYFTRCFHKIKGMTPTAYRKSFADARSYQAEPVADNQSAYPLNHYFTK